MTKRNMDQNDLLQARLLPEDPFADCDPVETPPAPGEAQEAAAPGPRKAGPVALGIAIQGAKVRLEARRSGREGPIKTPWPEFNEATGGGLWPGLVVLTGNTGSGKTQWAMQAGLEAAKAGHPVVYVGLELDELGLVCRLAALATDPPRPRPMWSDLYRGKGPRDALDSLDPALPFYLVAKAPGWKPRKAGPGTPPPALDSDPDTLASLTEAAAKAHPGKTPLVILDFLQLVGGEPREELRERIGQAAYAGREVARELGAVVIQLSSTARGNYNALAARKEGDPLDKAKGPGLDAVTKTPAAFYGGLGKESGEIEFAADLALVLVKPWTEELPCPVALGIAKQRAGGGGWIKLTFDGNCFGNGDPEPGNPAGELLAKAGKEGGDDDEY